MGLVRRKCLALGSKPSFHSIVALGAWASLLLLAPGALAQPTPPPAPVPVPVMLGTRDPSRFSEGPRRVTGRPSKASAAPIGSAPAAANGKGGAAVGSAPPDGSSPAASTGKAAPAAAATAVAAGGSGSAASDAALAEFAKINVTGLTGTLNKGDIHQTMEQRQPDFDHCVSESRRSLRWVSGAMRFAFKVDAEGRIAEVRTTSSTIGHRALEQCLASAVATTQFPKPAGRATAKFSWGLSVDPVSLRAFESASAKPFTKLARKQARELFETCGIKRRRARFKLTVYVAPGGRVLSAGAVPTPAHAEDKVDCVLEQLATWHLPKLKKASKLSFELR